MSAEVVTVGRMRVHCAVARNHPQPDAVRRRLDEVLAGPLQTAVASILEPLARLRSEEVFIIERLELDVTLDPSRNLDEVARRWAAQLASRLVGVLSGDTRTPHLRFADEAHYLARFLVDEAAGCAAGKWYYRRYRGYAALPTPAILRSAVIDDAPRGLAALATLTPAELGGVLAALGEREAERIVRAAVALDGDRDDFARAAGALAQAAARFGALDISPRARWTAALALTATAARLVERATLPSLVRLANALAAWRRDAEAGAAAAPSSGESALDQVPLFALTPSLRGKLEAALRPPATARAAVTPTATTRFGGMILLLARSADWPLERLFASARDRALLRLNLLSRCAGPSRRRGVVGDALLQRLCGLEEVESIDAVEPWAKEHAATIAHELPSLLAARHVPWSRSVILTIARAAGRTWALTIAEPDGYWLSLAPLDAALRARLGQDACGLALARVRKQTRLIRYLAADEDALGDDAEPALVTAAQALLHAFARTLPGFSESSPTFLYDNFLAFSATVEEVGGRSLCRMGRPPLAALLSLIGAQRGRLALPWLRGGGLELYAGG